MCYSGKKNKGLFRIAAITLVVTMAFLCLFPGPAWAARSKAGGGDVAKADAGDIATSIGMSVGVTIGTQILSGAIGSASKAATSQQFTQSAGKIGQDARELTTRAQMAAQEAMRMGNAAEAERLLNIAGRADALNMATSIEYANVIPKGMNINTITDISTKASALHNVTGMADTLGKTAASAGVASNLSQTAVQIQNAGGILNSAGHTFGTAGRLFTDTSHWGQGIKSVSNFSSLMPNVVSGFNTYVAASQTSRAAGMAGYYYGWKPSTTYIVSSVATGGIAGALNPEIAMGANNLNSNAAWSMTRGAAVGSLGGLGGALGTVAIDRNRIDQGKSPSALGLITGKATGLMSASFGRTLTDPDTYRKIPNPEAPIIEQRSAREMAEQDPEGKAILDRIDAAEAATQAKIEALHKDFAGGESAFLEISDEEGRLKEELREQNALEYKKFEKFQQEHYGDELTYLKVVGVDKKGQTLYASTEEGKTLLGRDTSGKFAVLKDYYVNANYSDRDPYLVVPDVYFLEKTGPVSLDRVLGRYGKAAFIEPFNSQNWPGLASQSLAIWAASSIKDEKKQYWTPLVQSMVSGLASPVFRNLASVYGIDSELLLGRAHIGFTNDITQARLRQSYALLSMAENEYLAGRTKEVKGLRDAYKNGKIKSVEAFQAALKTHGIWVEDPENIPEYAIFDPGLTAATEAEKKEAVRILAEKLSATTHASKEETEAFVTEWANKYVDKGTTYKDIIDINYGLVLAQDKMRLEAAISKRPVDEALSILKTNQNRLFFANALRGMLSGAFEGAISGGVESAFEKNYPAGQGSVVTQFIQPYTANMLTAVARGASWYYNWDKMSRQWDWQERFDYAQPQPYSLKSGEKGYNLIADKLDPYKQDIMTFKRLVYAAGVTEGGGLNYHGERTKWERQYVLDSLGKPVPDNRGGFKEEWVEKPEPVWMLSLAFPREKITGKPALTEAIARSIEQANMDYFVNTFTFGRPIIRGNNVQEIYGIEPKNISAYSFMTYLNNLGNLTGKGLGEAVLYQSRAANIGTTTQTGAVAKNVAGALLARPGVAKITYMQPERFVKVTTARQITGPWTRTSTAITAKVVKGKIDLSDVQIPTDAGKPDIDWQKRLEDSLDKTDFPGVKDGTYTFYFMLGNNQQGAIRNYKGLAEAEGYVLVTNTTVEGDEVIQGSVILPTGGEEPFYQSLRTKEVLALDKDRKPYVQEPHSPLGVLYGIRAGIGYGTRDRTIQVKTVEKGTETVYIPAEAPGLPSTVQQAGYGTGAHMGFGFYPSFPHPFYGARTQTGTSLDFLKRTGTETSPQQASLSGESLAEDGALRIINPFGDPVMIPEDQLTPEEGITESSLTAFQALAYMADNWLAPEESYTPAVVQPPAPAPAAPSVTQTPPPAVPTPPPETVPVAVAKPRDEFKGAVATAQAGRIPLTPEQAAKPGDNVSFRLEGNTSFMPGSPPPQAVPVLGTLGFGPSDVAPNPFIGNENNPDIVRAGDTTYIPSKDKKTALAVKPTADGKMLELSVVPSSEIPPKPVTPVEPMAVSGAGKSADKGPSLFSLAAQPAAPAPVLSLEPAPAPKVAASKPVDKTYEISASTGGPVIKEVSTQPVPAPLKPAEKNIASEGYSYTAAQAKELGMKSGGPAVSQSTEKNTAYVPIDKDVELKVHAVTDGALELSVEPVRPKETPPVQERPITAKEKIAQAQQEQIKNIFLNQAEPVAPKPIPAQAGEIALSVKVNPDGSSELVKTPVVAQDKPALQPQPAQTSVLSKEDLKAIGESLRPAVTKAKEFISDVITKSQTPQAPVPKPVDKIFAISASPNGKPVVTEVPSTQSPTKSEKPK